jgi:hypothetical protein
MDPRTTDPDEHEHPHHSKRIVHGQPAYHPHHVQPIDPGFRLIVRTVLWVIVGALIVGLCIWWVRT